MGLHYLILLGKNLENGMKLMPVQIMNCDSRDCKNIVNIVGISSDNIAYEQYFE